MLVVVRVAFFLGVLAGSTHAIMSNPESDLYNVDSVDDIDQYSFLEEEVMLQGTDHVTCSGSGDLHVYSGFRGGTTNKGNYVDPWGNNRAAGRMDVMGEEEWIMYRSKKDPFTGKPNMEVQLTQAMYQSTYDANRPDDQKCLPRYPHITVVKDMGVKCGDVEILYKGMRRTMNWYHCGADPKYNPEVDSFGLFIKGTVNGRAYDYEWVNPDELFPHRQIVQFDEGYVAVENFHTWCCVNGCPRLKPGMSDPCSSAPRITVRCGENPRESSNTALFNIGTHRSATYMAHVSLSIPGDANGNAMVCDGTATGGFCTGYATDAENRAVWDCHNKRSYPFFSFKGTSDGKPGQAGITETTAGWNMAGFYNDDDCRKDFLTTDINSIFRRFEMKTKGKEHEYDALRWKSDGTTELESDKEFTDATRQAAVEKHCNDLRRQVLDNREVKDLDTHLERDDIIAAAEEFCEGDSYFGEFWDAENFRDVFCSRVQQEVDVERSDIKCADELARNTDLSTTVIANLGFGENNSIFEEYITQMKGLKSEIEDSQQVIEYWDEGVCPLTKSELEQMTCTGHTFKKLPNNK